MRVAVAIVVVADLAEIPEAAVDRKVASPIVPVARECDALARIDLADNVGAGADRWRVGRILEGFDIHRVFRQNRHQAEDQRQLAIVAAGEIETHFTGAKGLRLDDLGIIEAVIGAALVTQELPGKYDVLGRHRLAVGESRCRIELERHIAARLIGVDCARDQPIKRERLVIAARHEAFDHLAADDIDVADQWGAHALRHQAPRDKGIDAFKSAQHALNQAAALRCVGIDIAEMTEIGGERGSPCIAMAWRGSACAGRFVTMPASAANRMLPVKQTSDRDCG